MMWTLEYSLCLSREILNVALCVRVGVIVSVIVDMWNGFPLMSHTAAARAGVENLTKSLAIGIHDTRLTQRPLHRSSSTHAWRAS